MKKIVIVILLLLLTGLGVYFIATNSKEKIVEPVLETSVEKEEITPATSTKNYENLSGFTFDYSEDLEIIENEDLDETVYTDLAITSAAASGSISLRIEDSKQKNISGWFKENPDASKSADLFETKLAEMNASEIYGQNELTLIVLDQGVLYQISVAFEDNKKYWQTAYDQIKSSFAFFTPQTTTSSSEISESSVSDDVLEEISE